jgi:microcystin-dependent protein
VALFSLLGTTYGGDGQTTFALPDLRGRMARGVGTGPGLQTIVLGAMSGLDQITLSASNMPAHAGHVFGMTSVKSSLLPSGVGSQATCATSDKYVLSMDGATSPCSGVSCSSVVGGNSPITVTPPYTALNFIIAVQGIYPTRP